MITYCLISSLLNAITSFILGLFVLSRQFRSLKHITYFLFSLSITLWSVFYGLSLLAETEAQALTWNRFAAAGIVFIPVFYLHHLTCLLHLDRSRKWMVVFGYLFALTALAVNAVGWLVESVSPKLMFPFWPSPGILFTPFLGIWIFLCMYASGIMWRHARITADSTTANQMKYILAGTLIGFFGGCTNLFLWYDIPFLPVGNILVSVYVMLTTYAIIRHRLMDIQVIFKRTLVFAGLFTFIFGLFSFGMFVGQEILAVYFGFQWELAVAVSIALIALGYEPMRKYLIDLTDKYLFQKKYDYQRLLKDASRGMSRIESLHHLLSLVVHFVTMKMRVRNACVLSRDKETGDFKMQYQRGYRQNFFEHYVPKDHPLIAYLETEKEVFDGVRLRDYLEGGVSETPEGRGLGAYDYKKILETMEEIDAACCVPSFLGPELRNILVLGKKKSGDFYTDQDMDVLYTLAQESAIAIENARLYDEAINKTRQLENINSQLEYAKSLLMRALKETEVANKQLQDTQAQLIHEQKMATLGRLAASVGHEVNNPLTILSMNVSRVLLKLRKNPDLKVSEIVETFDKMEQNIGRIKAVVNTLTGLLKKSEKGKFEPLSLKLVLEETLPLVQFQTYLDNLSGTEVEFNIPGNLPLIRGDLERLQEVFLNLFINAYHAMEDRPNRHITVIARLDTDNPRLVIIQFSDTGKGMTEEIMKKIFSYGFTTKAPGRGSGLGLYMCKYIIELHGGNVAVESKLGEGTTFTIRLPIAEEVSARTTSRGNAH